MNSQKSDLMPEKCCRDERENPTAKPADKPTVDPAAKPADKPTIDQEAKPADKPTIGSAAKPAAEPAEKLAAVCGEEGQLADIFSRTLPLLSAWYMEHARPLPWRADADAYRVWISEIMLQQTRIEAVKDYYYRFMEAFPTVTDLANASEEDVMVLWQGLGYYSRARNLHKTALICRDRFAGQLPADYDLLLQLPGIGQYTAGAVASIAGGQAVPAVDGNVCRIAARLTARRSEVDEAYRKMVTRTIAAVYHDRAAQSADGDSRSRAAQSADGDSRNRAAQSDDEVSFGKAGIYNQAIMELGETICLPKGAPLCGSCPLRELCRARREGSQKTIPVPKAKKARPVERYTVLLLEADGQIAVTRRPEKGLLAGLYVFPMLKGERTAIQAVEEAGVKDFVRETTELGRARHIFTHKEWEMMGYRVILSRPVPGDWSFVRREDLGTRYALPSAMSAFALYATR